MDGVWGPLAEINNLANGGPECAAQSSPQFKIITNLCLVSSCKINWLLATLSRLYTVLG